MWFIVSLYKCIIWNEYVHLIGTWETLTDASIPGLVSIVNDNDRLVTVSCEASDCQEPCAAPISGLFVPGNLHYLHVKCCLVHHRKLNHGRFCISIWILRQKLRLINNKILFCIFCNEFYCCYLSRPGLHLCWSWSGCHPVFAQSIPNIKTKQ